MRLPWPFQRRSEERPTESLPAPFPTPVARGEWRSLPALGETIGPAPLIAPNSVFAGGLATNPPDPTLGALGHHRSLDAPHGLALGVAKPVARQVEAGAVGSRPVADRQVRGRLQRRATSVADQPALPQWSSSAPLETTDSDPRTAPPPAPTAAPAPTPARAAVAPTPLAPAPLAPAPVAPAPRRAPVVARESAVRPQPLTTAPSRPALASAPAPAVLSSQPLTQRAAALPPNYNAVQSARSMRSMLSMGAAGADSSPAAPAVQRAPAAAPVAAAAMPGGSAPAVQAATTSPPAKLSLAQSRRAGLGAPLAAKPVTGVQREVADPAAEPAGQRAPDAPLIGEKGPAIQLQRARVAAPTPPAAPRTAEAAPLPLAHPRPKADDGSELVAPTFRPATDRAADVIAHPIDSPAPASTMPPAASAPLVGTAMTPTPAERTAAPTPAPDAKAPTRDLSPARHTRVQRQGGGAGDHSDDQPAAAEATPAAAAVQTQTQRKPADAPITGATAVQAAPARRPPAGLQRASSAAARAQSGASASRTQAPSAPPVRVLRDASVTGAAATLNAKAFTHAGDVYMPAHHGPLDRGPGRALLAHELTHVQQQRDLGSALPPEHTPEGQRLERAAQSAEQTGSLPLNLPLATVPAPRRSRATAVAQRSAERGAHLHDETETEATDAGPQYTPGTTGLSPGPTAAVQREPNSSTGSSALATAATAAAANATPQGFGTSAEQLDELASKLWDRLRHRLRRELLNERERAGMVADVRY